MRTRAVLLGLAVILVVAAMGIAFVPRLRGPAPIPAPAYWPTEGWRSTTPEEQGFDSAKLAEMLLTIRQKDIKVHSLLLIRRGYAFVDATFYPYDGTTPHDVASVTKSVMTTLIGIAADQGKLRLDQSMLSFFPGRPIANRDARKERITVRHLANMSSGLDCTPERDEATLKEMWTAADWVQFVLDRPVKWEPGTQFVYCSPGMHLLSAILQQATGMTALEFARPSLFAPLGIHSVTIWPADPQGVTRGWGDIRLLPQDMAKIGFLWRNRGVWNGRQVVSGRWVADSVKPLISTGEDEHYGYGWWVDTAKKKGEFSTYRADGRGGQYIIVVPSLDLLIVTTGGGFEIDEIGPLLIRAIGDMSRPLPANPAGVAQLQAAVRAVAQAPARTAVAPLPTMARTISGKTFVFAPNPVGLTSARFEFNDSAKAVMYLAFGDAQPQAWPVGLDGVYRMSRGGYNAPQGVRGYWADARTFVFEYAGITNNDHYTSRLRFEGDRVFMQGQETAHELGVEFEGRLQKP